MTTALRIDELLGRTVWTSDGHRIGRIEECRAQRDGAAWFVGEWLIGSSGLVERLGLRALLVVGVDRNAPYVARWDQVDVTDPAHVRLTCSVAELQKKQR